MHQLINSGKGKVISTTYGTMEAWATSRNGIRFPTLLNKFLLDTRMGEMVILVSKTSESQSIRASSLDIGSCSVTEVMIGSITTMKNT
jgi:hypothetical protein